MYACNPVSQINDLNKGKAQRTSEFTPNRFCIGGSHPEKHMESPNIESDIYFFKKKQIANVGSIRCDSNVFDNDTQICEKCRAEGNSIQLSQE
jgi:methylenetetrahydrofolate reductase (NADPH)